MSGTTPGPPATSSCVQPGRVSVMVFTCAVSCAIALTVAICHSSGRPTSVVGVALFLPGIAADVIAERLPEAGRVLVHEAQAAGPFRALPEIQVRDDKSRRTAVLGRERGAVVLRGGGRQ